MTPQQTIMYLYEMQKQLAIDHDMSMFISSSDVPEEELLAEYAKSKDEPDLQ